MKHKWNYTNICEYCDVDKVKILKYLITNNQELFINSFSKIDTNEILDCDEINEKFPCLTDDEFMIKGLIK